MPSSIGHAFAGATIVWAVRGPTAWKLTALCALFAALPDIDLVYRPAHRTVTHSISVAILVTIIAVAVTAWVTRWSQPGRNAVGSGADPVRNRVATASDPIRSQVGYRCDRYLIGLACGLAWSSHVLLDWLGADASAPYGIQALWPFSDRWFISGWDLFPGTERRQPFTTRAILINLRAAVQEIAIIGSVALAIWATRARKSTR